VDFFNRWARAKEEKCALHPLIHTPPPKNLAQIVVRNAK
jgi:hypothetical protein